MSMKRMTNRLYNFICISVLLLLVSVFALQLINPPIAFAANPDQPTNVAPVNGATDVPLTPVLQSSTFSDGDTDVHLASRWQISTVSGDYSSPVFDSYFDESNLVSIAIPATILQANTTYYWHVRYTDDRYEQSSWSSETSFTTTATSGAPDTPTNVSPTNGTTDITLAPTLQTSAFSDPDIGDSHYASQWQISTQDGADFEANVIYDSSLTTDDLVTIDIAAGILSNSSTYYWRVRYQDSYGNWSAYSSETSFSTIPWHAPDKPSNISPGHNAVDVVLTPTLDASNFHDADTGDTHLASRWQIRTDAGTYDTPVFDSGVDSENLSSLELVEGTLTYDEVYHWRVRYQDSTSQWSAWSSETLFNTITTNAPDQPSNVSPADAAMDIAVRPLLTSSAFTDADFVDEHVASQWQVTDTSGDYSDPLLNVAEDTVNKTSLLLTVLLDHGDTYYWRVRYKDSYDNWSAYSAETSFTVISSVPPATPSIDLPVDEATGIGLTPTLQSSDFSDADAGDTHTASQWQITTTSGDYSNPVYDSGYDTTNKTTIVIPDDELTENTTYYCQVRYQDSFGNWSAYSTEISFTTFAITADFTANNTTVETGQSLMITDNSTGGITSWNWNLGDGTTIEWTADTKPAGGNFAHQYTVAGTYTVSLQVSGPGGEDMVAKAGYITVGQAAVTGGGFPTTWVIVGVAIALALGFGGFYFYRRQAG